MAKRLFHVLIQRTLSATEIFDHAMATIVKDGGSREASPGLPLETNATGEYLAYYTESIKQRICMATGRYPHLTSTVNHQTSQAIMVRPCLSS